MGLAGSIWFSFKGCCQRCGSPNFRMSRSERALFSNSDGRRIFPKKMCRGWWVNKKKPEHTDQYLQGTWHIYVKQTCARSHGRKTHSVLLAKYLAAAKVPFIVGKYFISTKCWCRGGAGVLCLSSGCSWTGTSSMWFFTLGLYHPLQLSPSLV